MDWGLSLALSVIVIAALLVFTAVGENLTVIVQKADPARLAGQLSDSRKSPEFAPVEMMLVMLSEPLPEFVKVTV